MSAKIHDVKGQQSLPSGCSPLGNLPQTHREGSPAREQPRLVWLLHPQTPQQRIPEVSSVWSLLPRTAQCHHFLFIQKRTIVSCPLPHFYKQPHIPCLPQLLSQCSKHLLLFLSRAEPAAEVAVPLFHKQKPPQQAQKCHTESKPLSPNQQNLHHQDLLG